MKKTRKTLHLRALAAALIAMPATALVAQTPGTISDVRFQKTTTPATNAGSSTRTTLTHATYTGALIADLDGDGNLDLLYADKNNHGNTSQISANCYYGKGDGTFIRETSPFKALAFSCPVCFDADNDGNPDVLMSGLSNWSYAWNNLSTKTTNIQSLLYIATGDNGGRGYRTVSDTGIRPLFNGKTGGKAHNWVAAADYDHDGNIDLLMQGFDEALRITQSEYWNASRATYLYHGNGDGTFTLQPTPLDGQLPLHPLTDGSCLFTDMDNDGWVDIITNGYGERLESELYVYRNNGDGTFSAVSHSMQPTTDSSVQTGDLDGDGLEDLIVSGIDFNNHRKQFKFYRNLGNMTFQEAGYNDELHPIDGGQIAVGDVNNDGIADLLVGGHAQDYEHTTFLYVGQGGFHFTAIDWENKDTYGWAMSRISHGADLLADVNGDGLLDAFISGWTNGVCSQGCSSELWMNKSTSPANTTPQAPTAVTADYSESDGAIRLTWAAGTDTETPASALRYNIFVRNNTTGKCIMLVPADRATGRLRVSQPTGAVHTLSYDVKALGDGDYTIGVQSIDGANSGSPFATTALTLQGTAIETIAVTPALQFHDGRYCTASHDGVLKLYRLDGALIATYHVTAGTTIDLKGMGLICAELHAADGIFRLKALTTGN